jgi:Amt family ammonium transporter
VLDLTNNLWVVIAALLVFTMTISVGFLEVGEMGAWLNASLLKTVLITGIALVVMAAIGFNTAFAPTTAGGLIGRPFYSPGFFLGGFSTHALSATGSVWWSMRPRYFNTGLTPATYFLFETAFAAVTLALVALIVLRKMKLSAFVCYAIVYFVLIWNLPAAWIWNPTGWLAKKGRWRAGRTRRGRRGRPGDRLATVVGGATPRAPSEPAGNFQHQPRLAHVGWTLAVGRVVWLQPRERPRV